MTPLDDEQSSPQARAERLRRIRNLANLSREQMCDNGEINLSTLIGWEVARHGGLTAGGAKKALARVTQEGVVCTLEWLLYGIGQGPTVIPNFEKLQVSSPKEISAPTDEEERIITELQLFRQQFNDTIDMIVADQSMNPPFAPGDYIAGIKRYHNKISSTIGLDCIIQTTDGKLLLRRVLNGDMEGKFTLVCTQLQSNVADAIIKNADLVFAAPVIWLRKKDPK